MSLAWRVGLSAVSLPISTGAEGTGSQGQESRANQSGVAAGSEPGDRGIKAAGRHRGDWGVNTDFTPA